MTERTLKYIRNEKIEQSNEFASTVFLFYSFSLTRDICVERQCLPKLLSIQASVH